MSLDVAPQFVLDTNWRRWIAENHLLGTPGPMIVDILTRQGLAPAAAQAELDAVRGDAYVAAGEWMSQRLRKLESLLEAQQRMRSLVADYATVPRCQGLSREEFLHDFYAANRPVILTDVSARWPARERWTPDYLRANAGHAVVEVMTGRESDPRYEQNLNAHRTSMRFADYVDLVAAADTATNDFYLVANNHFLDAPEVAGLLADFHCDERYLDPSAAAGQVFLWFGPGGTVTPLHHDTSNVLLTQVTGSKRVVLVPALEAHRVYNEIAVYSQVDVEDPDLARHPLYAGATTLQVDVQAGEALFIPVGWWHHVHSHDTSISLSFTNFVFPNHFDWFFPHIDRP